MQQFPKDKYLKDHCKKGTGSVSYHELNRFITVINNAFNTSINTQYFVISR